MVLSRLFPFKNATGRPAMEGTESDDGQRSEEAEDEQADAVVKAQAASHSEEEAASAYDSAVKAQAASFSEAEDEQAGAVVKAQAASLSEEEAASAYDSAVKAQAASLSEAEDRQAAAVVAVMSGMLSDGLAEWDSCESTEVDEGSKGNENQETDDDGSKGNENQEGKKTQRLAEDEPADVHGVSDADDSAGPAVVFKGRAVIGGAPGSRGAPVKFDGQRWLRLKRIQFAIEDPIPSRKAAIEANAHFAQLAQAAEASSSSCGKAKGLQGGKGPKAEEKPCRSQRIPAQKPRSPSPSPDPRAKKRPCARPRP